MKKGQIVLIGCMFTIALAACNNETASSNQVEVASPEIQTPSFTPPPSGPSPSIPPPPPPTKSGLINANAAVNPAHGLPNHRCDLPVGAPLPSSNNLSNTKEIVAVNPAHGLPNHRCDLPVGAPLNTAPQK